MTPERERRIRAEAALMPDVSVENTLLAALDTARAERDEALRDAQAMAQPCVECVSLRAERDEARSMAAPASRASSSDDVDPYVLIANAVDRIALALDTDDALTLDEAVTRILATRRTRR